MTSAAAHGFRCGRDVDVTSLLSSVSGEVWGSGLTTVVLVEIVTPTAGTINSK